MRYCSMASFLKEKKKRNKKNVKKFMGNMFILLVTRNRVDFHSEIVEAKVGRKSPAPYCRHPAEQNRLLTLCK